MKLYLSGPMSGLPDFNFSAFARAAETLRGDGHEVVSPHELDGGTPPEGCGAGEPGYLSLLARDIRVVAGDDIEAVVVLPGWEGSRGARSEVAVARMLDKPVLAFPTLLPAEEWAPAEDGSGRRIVTASTGGRKETRLARFDLIPVAPLWEVARHYGVGAEKYEPRNWERGYPWSLSYQSLDRHAKRFWNGESLDPETGTHHLAGVVFHALALMEFERTHPELDDRPPPGPPLI